MTPNINCPTRLTLYVEFLFGGVHSIHKVARIEDVLTIKESSFVPEQNVIISDCGEIKILNIEEES